MVWQTVRMPEDDVDSPYELARRLLGLCGSLEEELVGRLGPKWQPHNSRGLLAAARYLRESDRQVNRYFGQIEAYALLRNAIAHDRYRHGEPIAAPFPETIASAEKLLDELQSPTTVERYMHRPAVADAAEPLSQHLKSMVANDFS